MKNKITNFRTMNKETFDAIRKSIAVALDDVGNKYGIEFKTGNISYSDTYFNIKVSAHVIGESGDVMTPHAEAFKHLAHLYDLKAEHLFTVVKLGGTSYKIIGLNSRAPKLPIMLQDMQTKKNARASAEMIKKYLS